MPDSEPLISLRGVSVQFSRATGPTLTDVAFDLRQGEFVGVVGPTGCGKSTFLHVLAGVIPHYLRAAQLDGDVTIFGTDSRELTFRKTTARIGLVLQDPEAQLFNLIVRDEIVWGLENRGLTREQMGARLHEALELFSIGHLSDRVTYDLSGGEKQRVALAAIYALKPDIVLLDNPTSQLDPMGAAALMQAVNRLAGTGEFTIVMVEDKIDELVEHAHRLVVMDRGRLVFDGSPRSFCQARKLRARIGLQASQVAELGYALQDDGLPLATVPLTLQEAIGSFRALVPAATSPSLVNDERPPDGLPEEGDGLFSVQAAAFTYPSPRRIEALKPLHLDLRAGEFVAIVGQNGSGKTTLAKCLSGHLRPTQGRVLVDGKAVGTLPPSQRVRRVGYVFQNPDHQVFKNTVWDEVAFGLQNIGMPTDAVERAVSDMLESVGLDTQRDRHPFRLSKGDRQRLAIAAVAVMRPSMLLVDEPTTGQDPVKAREVMDLLLRLNREDHMCVVIISHAMDLVAECAKRVVVLAEGQLLLDGSTSVVFSQPEVLARARITPPPVTRLGLSLGLVPPPVTLAEARHMIRDRVAS